MAALVQNLNYQALASVFHTLALDLNLLLKNEKFVASKINAAINKKLFGNKI